MTIVALLGLLLSAGCTADASSEADAATTDPGCSQCSSGELSCSDDDMLLRCVAVNGCMKWSATADCGAQGESCLVGSNGPACYGGSCEDAVQNQTETGVDCGGSCRACIGSFCDSDTSCASGQCSNAEVCVAAANRPPVADPIALTIDEDQATQITLLGRDPDNDRLQFMVASMPNHGDLLSASLPTVTYTPDFEFSGTDSFTVVASDGTLESEPAVVEIVVVSVNDVPVVSVLNQITVPQGTERVIDSNFLQIDDPDDPPSNIVIRIGGLPAEGTLELDGIALDLASEFTQADIDEARLTYQHDGSMVPDLGRRDSFSFNATDAAGAAMPLASFTIQLTGTNDPPTVGTNLGLDVAEHGQAVIDTSVLRGDDPDSPDLALTYTLTESPRQGAVYLDDVPLSEGDSWSQARLVEPSSLSYRHWDVEVPVGTVANDGFEFVLDDIDHVLEPAEFAVRIEGVNDLPNVSTKNVAVVEDGLATIGNETIAVSDLDNDPSELTVIVRALPGDGLMLLDGVTVLELEDALPLSSLAPPTRLSYQHSSSEVPFEGATDIFGFVVADGLSESAMSIVTVNLVAVDDPPNLVIGNLVLAEGGTDEISADVLYASDVDTEDLNLVFTITALPSRGQLLIDGSLASLNTSLTQADLDEPSRLSYAHDDSEVPAGGVDDQFEVALTDGTSNRAAAVPIHIDEVNDPPTAETIGVGTSEDTSIEIQLIGADPEGLPITFEVCGIAPSLGSLSDIFGPEGDRITYTGAPDANGLDAFEYCANDGVNQSAPASITIMIAGQNDAPRPEADAYSELRGNTTFVRDQELGLLANDLDPEETAFEAVPYAGDTTRGGQLVLFSDGAFIYTPPVGFRDDTDSFTYTVVELTGDSETATATVTFNVGSEVTWYVDNRGNDLGLPADGRDLSPLESLAAVYALSSAGDEVQVAAGDGTSAGYDSGLVLRPDQQLVGVQGTPRLTASTGDAIITASTGNISNIHLSLQSTARGIDASVAGHLTLSGVSASDDSGGGLSSCALLYLSDSSSADVDLTSVAVDGCALLESGVLTNAWLVGLGVEARNYAGGAAIELDQFSGSVEFTGLTITNGNAGFRLFSIAETTVSFDTINVEVSETAVDYTGFGDESSFTLVGASSVLAGGLAVGSAYTDVRLDSLRLDSGSFGLDLSDLAAGSMFTVEDGGDSFVQGVAIDSAAFELTDVADLTFIFNGDVTTDAGAVLRLDGMTAGGSVSLQSGSINSNGAGLVLRNALDSTVDITSPVTLGSSLTRLEAAGLTLDSNAGSITSIAALTIFTANNPAVYARSGGALSSENIVVDAVDGLALDVSETTLNVTFPTVMVANTSGGGLWLDGIDGESTVGLLTVTSVGGAGLSLSGVDSFEIWGESTVQTSGAPAIVVMNATVDLAFSSVSSTDSDREGVVLDEVAGSFAVTQSLSVDGPTDEGVLLMGGNALVSLGTVEIDRRATDGFVISNESNTIDISELTVANQSQSGGSALVVEDSSAAVVILSATLTDAMVSDTEFFSAGTRPELANDPADDGDLIRLSNNSGSFSLTGGALLGSGDDGIDMRGVEDVLISSVDIAEVDQFAIQAVDVVNLTLRNCLLDHIGDDISDVFAFLPDNAFWFQDIGGVLLIEDTVVDMSLNADGTSQFSATSSPPGAENSVLYLDNEDVDLVMNVRDCRFRNFSNDGLAVVVGGGSVLELEVEGSETGAAPLTCIFETWNGRALSVGHRGTLDSSNLTYSVHHCDFTSGGLALLANAGGPLTFDWRSNQIAGLGLPVAFDDAFRVQSYEGADVVGEIVSNLVDGADVFVDFSADGSGTTDLRIASNVYISGDSRGSVGFVLRNTAIATVLFDDNILSSVDRTSGLSGGGLFDAAGGTRLCARVSGNQFSGDAAAFGEGFLAWDNSGGDLSLDGFTGGDTAAAATYLNTQNPGADAPFVSEVDIFAGTLASGTCVFTEQ